MPNLKDLKNRIESVKSTRKITKAMQMVAAAKLRRAQESAEAARPYSEQMNAVLGNLAKGAAGKETGPRLLIGSGSDQTHLLMASPMTTSPMRTKSSQNCCRVPWPRKSLRLCWKMVRPSKARGCLRWITLRVMPAR